MAVSRRSDYAPTSSTAQINSGGIDGKSLLTPVLAGKGVGAAVAKNQALTQDPGIVSTPGGGGGGSSAVSAAPSGGVNDIDWFNQDPQFRADAGGDLADLTSQLAQLMSTRDQGYQQFGNQGADLTRSRTDDLTSLGNDFGARGTSGSGLYAQKADQLAAQYARQQDALNQQQQNFSQQYGQQGGQVDLSGLTTDNASARLPGLVGLLGALGVGAGDQYQQALTQARNASASRSATPLIQTTQW